MQDHPYQNLHWYPLTSSKSIWPKISVAYFRKWFQSISSAGGWRMYCCDRKSRAVCAKLRTVAASNNRVHMPWSLYYYLFAPHICMVLFFTHNPFVVNRTFNATPPERLQQYPFNLSLLLPAYIPTQSCKWASFLSLNLARTRLEPNIYFWNPC